MNTVILIPSRMASVRFPGKPLMQIQGKTMIQRVSAEHELPPDNLLLLFPRGAIDMAVAFHNRDDSAFITRFKKFNQKREGLRIRDQINDAINFRLKVAAQN